MDAAWAAERPLSVQETTDAIGGGNYKTVTTVLNRLVEKELLARELDGRAYRYSPAMERAAFLRAAADGLVREYLAAFGEDAGRHLAEAAGGAAAQPPAQIQSPPPPPTYHIHQPPAPRPIPLGAAMLAAAVAAGIIVLARRRGG